MIIINTGYRLGFWQKKRAYYQVNEINSYELRGLSLML
jgi:hypothetical protein